jgi:hypothetical protein
MAATHKLLITFDEAAGTVGAVHRCTVVVAGQSVSHAREVELGADAAAALASILDVNRAQVEAETGVLAVSHAAAVLGQRQPGVIPLKVGGTLGPIGTADTGAEG